MELLKAKVSIDPAFLGLPNNITEIKYLYIKSQVTDLDAFKFPNLARENLENVIEKFFSSENEKVFGLFGVSGSGKSTLIQLRFYEDIMNWH